jgi:hypothetical protein
MEMSWDGVDRIYLAHDRDQWAVFVNTVMNLRDLLKYKVG